MTEHLNYNDFGLAIGFISYSFKTDGKELFDTVFRNDLFFHHRENLARFTNETIDQGLYIPKGYRLFGNHGIAVLSLIDDYAFCNRIFNDNHTHDTTGKYKWSAKIITGVGDEGVDYLYNKARQTFLRETDRYPFIGIMKVKIDHRLLYGKGIRLTRLIKKTIKSCCLPVSTPGEIKKIDYIIVDCFDNDEMSIIAFSDSLHDIHRFMENIRNLKYSTIVDKVSDEEKPNFRYTKKDCKGAEIECDKHIFTSCHINLGYDVGFSTELRWKKDANGEWEKVPVKDLSVFLVSNEKGASSQQQDLIFICEAKPGHSDELEKRIRLYFTRREISGYEVNRSLTGGSIIHISLPVEHIGVIESMCKSSYYNDHIRRVKISLRATLKGVIESDIKRPHGQSHDCDSAFNNTFIEDIKMKLNKCGVSKIIRERFLSLYRLYNESAGNLLHSAYFKELEDALRSMKSTLEDFLNDDTKSIKEMDEDLSRYIATFEEAFYNRFHEKGVSNNNLEYNGSVQQYLTSFDFLYKQLMRVIVPQSKEAVDSNHAAFVSITGHERVSSTRINLLLNINQITYPEFFATTVWKEAANHMTPFLENIPTPTDARQIELYKRISIWKSFMKSDTAFDKIRFFLDKDSYPTSFDAIYEIVHERLDREFLDYIIIDQIVYHFGFQRNYRLLWHFYWKTFLQTSMVYSRKGEINIKFFVDMLLRLVLVRINDRSHISPDQEADYNRLVEEQKKPYDSLMTDLWLSCYDKVCDCAESIYKTLDRYEFSIACEDQICAMEHNLARFTPDIRTEIERIKEKIKDGDSRAINKLLVDYRAKSILPMQALFAQSAFTLATIEEEKKGMNADYAVRLLNAFLRGIMCLDLSGKENAVIRSVPRDSAGDKRPFIKEPHISGRMINMPADPFGGVLIPDFSIRKKYFSIRTTFYRSVWHYKMISESI